MKNANYYELLKVSRKASVTEIVSAYHSARNAFSKESLAAYSLYSVEEAEQILHQLEQAYLTLSNIDRKREYDRLLEQPEAASPVIAPVFPISAPIASLPSPVANPTAATLPPQPVSDSISAGVKLRILREQNGLSVEDVCRLTKIPARALRAIESDNLPELPARVYLQGFVSNLAKLYRADPATTVKGYLSHIDLLRQSQIG